METKVIDANTPVLKYSRTDGEKIELDISVNNILGCVNSRMLLTLSQIHPIIPKLGIVIKKWAKTNKILTKSNLSSYSLILMMFSFMFKEKKLDSYFIIDRKNNLKNKDYIV